MVDDIEDRRRIKRGDHSKKEALEDFLSYYDELEEFVVLAIRKDKELIAFNTMGDQMKVFGLIELVKLHIDFEE